MRLLLVEDDEMLGHSLKKGLGFADYQVEWAMDRDMAYSFLDTMTFDMAVIDLQLPDGSGINILTRIRRDHSMARLPVLILTAMDRITQKITALDAGADDYLTKPFEFDELLARLRAIMRRSLGQADNHLHSRDLCLDLLTHQISRGDIHYLPTAYEFKLICLLMQRPGKIISKNRIEEELYGSRDDVESNVVEVLVYNLRRKLGKDVITTIRGVGYMVAT